MGWCSAVAVCQHVHRNFVRQCGLPGRCELRKGKVLAANSMGQVKEFFQVYVDNVDAGMVVDGKDLHDRLAWTETIAEKAHQHGIPYSEDKRVRQQFQATTLGAEVLGDKGCMRPPRNRLAKLWRLTLYVLGMDHPSQKMLAMLSGAWVFMFQFRRSLMATFDMMWRAVSHSLPPSSWGGLVASELVIALSLCPLAMIDLRRPSSTLVSASDASSRGAGVAMSVGLSAQGRSMAKQMMIGERLKGNTPIYVVEFFSQIGGCRVAAEVAGVTVQGHLLIQVGSDGVRVLQDNFGTTSTVMEVPALTESFYKHLAERIPSHTHILVVGMAPYGDAFKKLKIGAHQGHDPALDDYTPLDWFVGLVAQLQWVMGKHRVDWLYEAMDSIPVTSLSLMCSRLGSNPILVDGAIWTQAIRRRLYWTSWEIKPDEVVTISVTNGSAQASVQENLWPPSAHWLDRGALVHDGHPLPTLVRPIPRARPPQNPSGLTDLKPHERRRWEMDSYRLPPYQYADECMIFAQGCFRTPSAVEAEVLQGYVRDFTVAAGIKIQQAPSVKPEDVRLGLLSSAFHVPSLVWLLKDWLFDIGATMAYDGGDVALLFGGRSTDSAEENMEQTLVRHLSLRQNHRGGVIQTLSRTQGVMQVPSQIPTTWWEWREVFGAAWSQHDEHINTLELRAVTLAVRARMRKPYQQGHRFLHLVDSLVVMGALSKGRSSSSSLRNECRKIAAILLATNSFITLGFVRTHNNPADKPSRRAGMSPRGRPPL
eukprot:6490479-Amphidinium_carterae.1